jgi:hypothetical protein
MDLAYLGVGINVAQKRKSGFERQRDANALPQTVFLYSWTDNIARIVAVAKLARLARLSSDGPGAEGLRQRTMSQLTNEQVSRNS